MRALTKVGQTQEVKVTNIRRIHFKIKQELN